MHKSIEELQAYKARLETDLRRSRMIDPDGIGRNTPLFRNLEQVNKDISNYVPVTDKTVLAE